jgi:hypothetical protein
LPFNTDGRRGTPEVGDNFDKSIKRIDRCEEMASSECVFQTDFKNKALSFQPRQVFSFEERQRDS